MSETGLDTTVAIAELKARLSHYLRAVKAGREIAIAERGRIIARIVPASAEQTATTRIEDLIATGAAREPTRPLPVSFWEAERPRDAGARSLQYLLEERRESR